MPELPEVETVRRVLAPHLKKRTITDVQIVNGRVIASPGPEELAAQVKGQTIADFARRGKFLQLIFAGGDTLTLHFRMTGCLTLEPQGTPCQKHTHLIFLLDDGNELRYDDARRFGKFWFTERDGHDVSGIDTLGPEPFDKSLSASYLRDSCAGSRRSVKEMLLDQGVIAGIGNIYSDEILFSARIRPDRPCSTLTDEEWERLAACIPERMAFFIERNAISFEEYASDKGKEYRSTPDLKVYGKPGKPCPICGSPLQRIVLGGRSSVFCPHCQD